MKCSASMSKQSDWTSYDERNSASFKSPNFAQLQFSEAMVAFEKRITHTDYTDWLTT